MAMKEYSLADIEATSRYFESQQFPVYEASVGDVSFKYSVLPQHLAPDLPDFAFRMTHRDPENKQMTGIYGVSESVPEEMRPYWAAHEVIEFEQIDLETQGRCASAEERILALVPDRLKTDFINRRVTFFDNLVGFFRKDITEKGGNFTPADVNEALTTLQFLKRQQPPARRNG